MFNDFLNRHPLPKFIWQTIKSMAAIVVIFTLLAWVPEQPAERWWLLIYSLPMIFGGIIWFLVWLWRRHGGSAAMSVIAAVLVLSGTQYAFMRRDADIARRAVVDDTRALERDIRVVDLSDLMKSCVNQLCVEVLAKTDYDIILGDGSYRTIRGDACYDPAYESSRFRFLKAGFVGICHGVVEASRPTQLLVVEDRRCHASTKEDEWPCGELPDSFGGRIVMVRVESSQGSHVVRRWLEGGIKPINGWFAFVGLETLSVGDWLDYGPLLTRVLNVEVRGYGVSEDSDLDQLLTELEGFLENAKYADEALQAFWDVSFERGRKNQGKLVTHIERLIEHEDRNHILAGLKLITPRSQVDVLHLRSRFIQLSQNPDAAIRDEANRALRYVARVSTQN